MYETPREELLTRAVACRKEIAKRLEQGEHYVHYYQITDILKTADDTVRELARVRWWNDPVGNRRMYAGYVVQILEECIWPPKAPPGSGRPDPSPRSFSQMVPLPNPRIHFPTYMPHHASVFIPK